MPKVQTTVKEFFNNKPLRGVNPDEVVDMGAAIQDGVLKGDIKDICIASAVLCCRLVSFDADAI